MRGVESLVKSLQKMPPAASPVVTRKPPARLGQFVSFILGRANVSPAKPVEVFAVDGIGRSAAAPDSTRQTSPGNQVLPGTRRGASRLCDRRQRADDGKDGELDEPS